MRRDAQNSVLELIEPLYAAEFTPDGWPNFLRRLMKVMESDIGIAVLLDREGRPLEFLREGAFSEDMMHAYEARFAAIDPWARTFLSSERQFGKNVTSQELLDPRDFEKTEYYNNFWRPNDDLFHTCGALIDVDDGSMANVGLPRRRDRGAYDSTDVAILDALSPHIRSALRMRQRLKRAEAAAANAEAGLDRIEDAVVIASGRRQVLYANPAAECEFLTGARLQCRHGVLAAGSALAQNEFDRAFDEASSLSKLTTTGMPSLSSLSSKEADPRARSIVVFFPLPRSRRAVGGAAARRAMDEHPSANVLVMMSRRGARSNLRGFTPELLQRAYGLTVTEARVAEGLCRGESVEAIAGELCMGIGTARVHLKHIFSKTGTRRQGELVSLLFRLYPSAFSPPSR